MRPVLPASKCVEILHAENPNYDRTSSMQTGAVVMVRNIIIVFLSDWLQYETSVCNKKRSVT